MIKYKEKENSIKIKFVACLPPAADDEVTENNNRCGRIGAGAAELQS